MVSRIWAEVLAKEEKNTFLYGIPTIFVILAHPFVILVELSIVWQPIRVSNETDNLFSFLKSQHLHKYGKVIFNNCIMKIPE